MSGHYIDTLVQLNLETQHQELDTIDDRFFGGQVHPDPPFDADSFVQTMNDLGCDKAFITGRRIFSQRAQLQIGIVTSHEVHQLIREHPTRLFGIAAYDPHHIEASLDELTTAVSEYGFKGAMIHTMSFSTPANDRRLYPLYAKCLELNIPVVILTGNTIGEFARSEAGRPIYIDDVAIEWPNLRIIASHTGWPWCEEYIAMAYKHKNVYCNIAAHAPMYLDPSYIRFIDSRGRNKCLYASWGLDKSLVKSQFSELPLREESRHRILKDNATELFQL